MVSKFQTVLNKAILHHVLPLLISLTGGNVCSRQMVILDQDQHLLGEYFYNSRWLVLVDKRKFFGRYPQWYWSPLSSIKWSWFHRLQILKYLCNKESQNIRHRQGFSSIQGLAVVCHDRIESPRPAEPHSSTGSLKNCNLGPMIQYLGCSFL